MSDQPGGGILGIFGEPTRRAAEAKAVAPGVHITHQAMSPDTRQFIGKYDLQVADRGFLEIVTSRIPIKMFPAAGIHADYMAGFVEHRVNGRIRTQENCDTDNAGLGFTPVTARNRRVLFHVFHDQTEALEKTADIVGIEIADNQDVLFGGADRQIPDSCIITIRTRSSAIASRSKASSFSLPRTRVSSQV